jgi:hypothetical protein
MTSDAVKINQMVWLGAAFIAVGLLGFFLASDAYFAFFVTLAILLIGTLPYHSNLAVYLSVATFSSAIIIPFAPGRPYLWEFAGLLGWSGLLVTVAMRRYKEDFISSIRENKLLFIGIVGYISVLIFTMYVRGFGLRIMGGGQMGGRFYFQQIVCAIFPFIFVMIRPEGKTMTRLVILQYVLSITFLISEFTFVYAPREFQFVLQFLDVSGDTFTYSKQASGYGYTRMASMMYVGHAFLLIMLASHKLSDFFSVRGFYLVPLAMGILFLSLFSGHRVMLVEVFGIILVLGCAQRIYRAGNVAILGTILILSLALTYLFVDQLPMSVQRSVSFLPGIEVQQVAYDDAYGTLDTRRILRSIGMEMIPDYFWLGRGFAFASGDDSLAMLADPTGIGMHVAQGRFYNGFIGLMVNTGVFGTIFMFAFMIGGTILSFRIIKRLRILGCDDMFLRICGGLASLWVVAVFMFIFLHGDSEYAMKMFALQAGMLLVCDYHLKMRMLKA